MRTLLYNAHLVLPTTTIENGWLLVEDKTIRMLGTDARCPSAVDAVIDAAGGYILPGLIDLHCDTIEKIVEPRPGVRFALPQSLQEADVRLAACGITTEFHAVSLDDGEFSLRSDVFVRELCELIAQTREQSLIRHKVHARLELTSQRGYTALAEMIPRGIFDLVSLMNHSPGQGQYPSEEAYREYIFQTTGKSYAEIDLLLLEKKAQNLEVPKRIKMIARMAHEMGLALATHDDDTATKVEQWPALGVRICEFPTTLEAARHAHELGLTVCMGAPNVLRGRSSGGNLSALTAIKAGATDVLCADYYPAALLSATFALVGQHVLTLPDAVRMVTLNPARAAGLGDSFGSLEVGKTADLLLVRPGLYDIPLVERVFVAGREVLHRSVC